MPILCPDKSVDHITFVDLAKNRTQQDPDRVAYTFLSDGDAGSVTMTYAQLDRRARSIAAALRLTCARGDRVLLLFPPGLDYIEAFFGCLYAGVIAVPAYPPSSSRLERALPRLRAMVADSTPTLALTVSAMLGIGEQLARHDTLFEGLRWLATETLSEIDPDGSFVDTTTDSNAFLQYTSGSTAAPKGVVLTHANLMHNSELIARLFGHNRESRGVVWLPPYHDMGLIGGILQPLYAGFPVTLMSPVSFLQRPLRWLTAISSTSATTSGGPNFAYDLCARQIKPEERESLDLSHWQVAFNGAEPIRGDTLDRFAEAFEPCGFRREAFYPCYGLAESTLIVSGKSGRCPKVVRFESGPLSENRIVAASEAEVNARTLVSSGTPATGLDVAIVDPEMSGVCEPDCVGEIWVSGPSVAAGYWAKPEQTELVFSAYSSRIGSRPYLRTGDLGALVDGELYVTGRLKDLIIVRGRNHYPSDIELTAERSHPALRVGSSAAFTVDSDGEERLVLVHELDRQNRSAEPDQVVEAIRQAVSEAHELQVYAVALLKPGRLPKTSSGKVQRHACRAAYLANELDAIAVRLDGVTERQTVDQDADVAVTRPDLLMLPAGDRRERLERYLTVLVAGALKLSPVAIRRTQSITALGLDSLAAVELQHALETTLRVTVPMTVFLDGASIDDIAARVSQQIGQEPTGSIGISPSAARSQWPLSFAQEQLWFLNEYSPNNPAYNICASVRMKGVANIDAVAYGLREVADRHAIMRTTFDLSNGRPRMRVGESVAIPLPMTDLSSLPDFERDTRVRSIMAEESLRPFDLAVGPLIRSRLLKLSSEEHLLLLSLHHIVSDGWSMGVLVREMAAYYRSFGTIDPPDVPELPIQFGDFSTWQRGRLPDAAAESLNYWKQQLSGQLPTFDLPTDRPRPPVRTFNGATERALLPRTLTRGLKALSQEADATLYMTLLAAFLTLLNRYTSEDDLVIGTRVNGRTEAQTQNLIGFFVNALVIRANLSGDPTYRELLNRVRTVSVGALAHQDVPFELVIDAVKPPREPSRHPLFQVMFVLQNFPKTDLDLPGLRIETAEVDNGTSKFDIDFTLRETPYGLAVTVEYNTDLFYSATVARMIDHYQRLLRGIVENPDQRISELPLLTAAESQYAMGVSAAYPEDPIWLKTLSELFEAQAAATPDAPAVVCQGKVLTFDEVNRYANRMAHALRSLGVGPDVCVGVCLDRSLKTLPALLGVLKAGGAYVPLDPAYPKALIDFILADTQAPVIVSDAARGEDFFRDQDSTAEGQVAPVILPLDDHGSLDMWPDRNLPATATVENLSHVMYTSGSTGQPKGVLVPQSQLLNRLAWTWRAMPFAPGEVACQRSSVNFSPSLGELLGPVLQGVCVVIVPDDVVKDPARLVTCLAANEVTRLLLVPSLLRAILETNIDLAARLPHLTTWITAGEPLSHDLFQQFRARLPCVNLWNDYGSTETHGVLSFDTRNCGSWTHTVPLGFSIDGVRAMVLDRRMQPCPIGVPGEIHVASSGLARGYLNRPDVTAVKFVPNPHSRVPGARLFKTGDIGRVLPSGMIEFLGRLDFQVKIRGVRIEVEGIETALREHKDVGQAVVAARPDSHGESRLVAYVRTKSGQSVTTSELRRFLLLRLAESQVPSVYVTLESFPVLPSGKVNRRGLPDPSDMRPEQDAAFMPPRTELEGLIARIWSTELQVEKVGVHDNFFDLGGHSLLMVRVHAALRESGIGDIGLVTLFQYPTVSALAAHLSEAGRLPSSAKQGQDRASMRRDAMQRRRSRSV